jgi:hypothetical protein
MGKRIWKKIEIDRERLRILRISEILWVSQRFSEKGDMRVLKLSYAFPGIKGEKKIKHLNGQAITDEGA